MTTVIRMPAFTATMESGKLINWLVDEGATVEKGQVIAEVETDKAIAEIESPVAGEVLRILVAAGDDDIDVEVPLVELRSARDGDGDGSSGPTPQDTPVDVDTAQVTHESDKALAQDENLEERVPASPSARRVARDAGINLEEVKGSGPGGRITKEDVVAHVNSASSAKKVQPAEISPMRLAIAKSMVQSKTSVPHFYTETDVVIDDLVRLKDQLSSSNPGIRITLTTLLVQAVAKALDEVKEAKFRWENGNVEFKEGCDIGVAVAVDSGIVVPVIRNADALSVLEIASRLNQFVADARAGSLRQSDLGDASLTLSNLGMYSIDAFYPIVNMPEPLIVGVGRLRRIPVAVDDEVEIHGVVTITLAVDHRVIDGATAGRFATALQHHIETANS
jgi:pyruvate dehydrogenase E2 component (dihydrolipoamide acetyltransferase)